MPALRYSTPEGVKMRPLQETFTIGRAAQNDLALPDDPKVSQQHARIRQEGDTYVLEDLQSTNGTFLEREFEVTRITAPQPLRPNDVIRVGATRLAVCEDVSADTPPDTPPASAPDAGPPAPTQGLGQTRVGRWLPEFMQPPEESAPAPHAAQEGTHQEGAQRIAELEQQLAELKAQLAKKQGEG